MHNARIALVMGSASDGPRVAGARNVFERFAIACETKVLSAHRTPDEASSYFSSARERGIQVIICAAGGAAHLAGTAAAHTTLPVIGIPLASSDLSGIDALYSTVQMPPGIPVATVSVGDWGATNAALLALSILSVADEAISRQLSQYRASMREKVLSAEIGQ